MIRLATAADLDAVVALHTEARATYYRGHLPDADFLGPEEIARSRAGWAAAVDRGAVLCAVRDGEIAGIAAYGEREGLMHLTQLHVLPARWRAGIGAELHAACVEKWRAAGVTTVRLDVFDKNERAQAFYTAQGWTPDPQTPRHGDHLVLRLTLAAETE
ncbi:MULTISPECIES: GNAT family N-acetyltransferase [Streptomyces]|uniref:GCN5-related N-acetyltransferase n=1 Tax=Streptomyces venezuelae (strain ATCC 10712 / CBS 650.69 / DSM 40230 / JCM 4526 / NBRC 13096 / PD 04745) TaxID=953739 RepID=F2RGI7_STRVP|nr:GNAT family N-acetyltransferase [Streptomyces venezuelae]APE20856.1 GNAT family N-acetyltransferase [Streptomyces venezuelae]QER98252.1 GNAT family N-acetyltransferase [Streptomyces venezuelae ATCC 10712]QES15809.1 GNAT family N-acetyltransferase [Streptomyces venezuelae]CCA54798.1 GCN5-related N-acetyltransferase [Streptomyces venezuelae ATCC 10712]